MKPKVILYAAISLDGKTTGFPVDLGLFYSLAQWGEDASLVGCDTLLNAPEEIPEETGQEEVTGTPDRDDPRPFLVVPDSRGRLRSWHYWRTQPYWKECISLCSHRTPPEYLTYLASRGVKTVIAGETRVDLAQALEELNQRFAVKVVRVDSGGTLNGALLRAGLVDQLHLLVHPTLVGGTSQKTFFADLERNTSAAIPLRFLAARLQPQGLVLLSYAVEK